MSIIIKIIRSGIFAIILFAIFIIVAGILYFLKLEPLITLVGAITLFAVSCGSYYINSIINKKQIVILGFIANYLVEKEESYVDDILDEIMAGNWKKIKIDPVTSFFDTLERLAQKSNFNMRRRITESLPALFQIDISRGKELARILRYDWDTRYKSDNRRRTIEALSYIIKKEKKFVKVNLHLHADDQLFVIIAIIEIIYEFRKINFETGQELFNILINEMEGSNSYTKEEVIAMRFLWEMFLQYHRSPNPAGTLIDIFQNHKNDENIYIKICVARNLKYLLLKYPKEMLNFMDHFLQKSTHKYIRRPISKEDSVDCLIILLKNRRYCQRSKEILMKLFNDEDEIIPSTTFDKIRKILDADNEFGRSLIDQIIEESPFTNLVERAKRKKELI